MAVAGVAGLLTARLDLGRCQAQLAGQELADVAPVLRRGARAVRNAGVGLAVVVVVAVLQAGEGTDRVGVGRTLSRFAVARDLTGLGGKGAVKKAAAKKDWAEVLKHGPEQLKTNPWDVPTLRAMAYACEAHAYNEVELRYLKNALDANPKDVEVNRHCALSLARMGQFDQAIACWHRIAESKRDYAEAQERMRQLNAARDVLRDPGRRAAYDRSIGIVHLPDALRPEDV